MKQNPRLLLLTTSVLAVAVWFVSSSEPQHPETIAHPPRSPRDRHTGAQRSSTSKHGKNARELSHDDLLAIRDRDGAAAALAAAKSQLWPHREGLAYFILTQLAGEHPEFVAAELKTAGLSASLKGGLVDAILKNWNDGRKALDWAENQLTGELRCKAVAGALGILVRTEPEAAFGYFEEMSPSKTRRQAICDLFAAWGSLDPETALMRANELTPDDARSATEHVLRGWTKADPAAAAAWVLETSPGNEQWIAGVYQSWILLSPDQAKLWFDSLPEGNTKATAFCLTHSPGSTIEMPIFSARRVVLTDSTWASKPISDRDGTDLMNWAIQDTEGARSFVEQNGNDPAAKQLAAQVARTILGKDGPTAAIDWVLRLSQESGNREQALGQVFYQWAENDPAAAAGKLTSMSSEQTGKLPISLVNRWVDQDPDAAADWVAGWKGGEQAIMIEDMIDAWPDQDPKAAYQWLGTLSAGDGRDAGIKTMIHRQRDSAPDTLQPWIDLISNPQLREKTRREMAEYLKTVRDE